MRLALVSTVVLASFAAAPAFADGFTLAGGAALSFAPQGDASTRSDLNLYLEGGYANFYLGVSADVYNDRAVNEVDVSLGYRNTTAGGLSYDLSYTRYTYPNDGGDCCGDVYLSLSMPVTDALTATAKANYYPEDKLSDAHLSLDYALNDKVTLTGSVGVVQNDGALDTREWELAVGYALGDETAVKLHYYDGSDYQGYLGLDLTWDTTLLGG